MLEPVRIDPDAVYDDGVLTQSLGFSHNAVARARRTGILRSTRQGHRNVYLGRWVLDWLNTAERPEAEAVEQ